MEVEFQFSLGQQYSVSVVFYYNKGNMTVNLIHSVILVKSITESLRNNQANDFLGTITHLYITLKAPVDCGIQPTLPHVPEWCLAEQRCRGWGAWTPQWSHPQLQDHDMTGMTYENHWADELMCWDTATVSCSNLGIFNRITFEKVVRKIYVVSWHLIGQACSMFRGRENQLEKLEAARSAYLSWPYWALLGLGLTGPY